MLDLFIEGKLLSMEIDCGSAVTVINKRQYFSIIDKPLKRCNKNLAVVNGSKLDVLGEVIVSVKLRGKEANLKLLVLDCNNNFIPLLGRSWLDVLFPNWRNFFSNHTLINNLMNENKEAVINDLKQQFSKVFVKDFSTPIVGFKADLVLRTEVPIFKKAYDVPYRLKQKVDDYLDKLENQRVITPIKTSEWASPVIVVIKKNDQIRLVIDCKVSINKMMIPNTYPLPTAQDLFAKLAESKMFCALDLEGAYTQLELTDRSKQFMVINTTKGLYTYNRLPQGATSSAAIFQQIMDQVLHGIEGVYVYLDDVLISGKSFEDCASKLREVLSRLSKTNIKINLDK